MSVLISLLLIGLLNSVNPASAGVYRDPSREEMVDESSFDLCQKVLERIIDRLELKEDIYKLLLETGARINYWMFEREISGSNRWCQTKSEETPLVHFNWNPRQNNCVNVEIFNENGTPNSTEHICDLSKNSFEVQREITNLKFNSGKIVESNSKTKRSLARKFLHPYVNLAREIDSTECCSPNLNVYFNEELVFSNASGIVGNDVPIDSIEVHIDVDTRRFYNLIPGKTEKGYLINTNPMTMYEAITACTGQGKILLDIESNEETNKVVAAMSKNQILNYWTSGHNLGPYSWHWHSSGASFQYTNWDVREPRNIDASDMCIKINQQGGTWSHQDCSSKLPFICEGTSVTKPAEIPPTVNIFIDQYLAYEVLPPSEHKDQSNVVEVTIGINGDAVNDHSTKFLLLQKNSLEEEASEQRLVTPRNFEDSEFNGIDIRIENIKQKGLICEKEKFYYVHTEEKLNYIDAHKFCQSRSMQLVSIQNEIQHLNIERIMLKLDINHYYWTSGYLAADGTTWLWNGNESVTYSNWAKGKPDNRGGNEKCIEIFVPWKTAKWNDQDCQDKNRIICESYTEPYWRRVED